MWKKVRKPSETVGKNIWEEKCTAYTFSKNLKLLNDVTNVIVSLPCHASATSTK